jgi:hypothetical protein
MTVNANTVIEKTTGNGKFIVNATAGGITTAAASSHIISGSSFGSDEIKAVGLIDNSGQLTAESVSTTGALTNSGTITGNATANGDNTVAARLDNSGTINGNATAANSGLANRATGTIKGNTTAYTDLTNEAGGQLGASGKTAKAITGDLHNDGTITGNAEATAGALVNNTAANTVNNSIKITGTAKAGSTLDNRGAIGGNATAGGLLTNHIDTTNGTQATIGTVVGDGAVSTAGSILNKGKVVGNSVANQNVDNVATSVAGTVHQATFTGDATATNGYLQNDGTITGSATAGTTFTNSGIMPQQTEITPLQRDWITAGPLMAMPRPPIVG